MYFFLRGFSVVAAGAAVGAAGAAGAVGATGATGACAGGVVVAAEARDCIAAGVWFPRVIEVGVRVPEGACEIIPPGADTLVDGFPVGIGNSVEAGGVGEGWLACIPRVEDVVTVLVLYEGTVGAG